MRFEYNMDDERRKSLLNIRESAFYKDENGDYDILRYENLDVKTLKILLDEKFADPEECQNDCPSIETVYEFMTAHPEFTAHGYIVTPKRDDYRVSIEGVEGSPETPESVNDFVSLFRFADEFQLGRHCFCWFD